MRLNKLPLALLLIGGLLIGGCAAEPEVPMPAPEAEEQDPHAKEPQVTEPEDTEPEPEAAEPEPEAELTYSIDDPDSIWVVSNKLRPLNPIDYEPNDLVWPDDVVNANGQPLRLEAALAAQNLVFDAAEDWVHIGILSAYRPYNMQVSLYNGYIARDGQDAADRYSARPGHSEHQTGLVIDFDDFSGCGLMQCFESTPAGIWLQEHAADYGFIMRYPDGYEHITGFMYEPWHYRYVGPSLAQDMRAAGVNTLEEWFGLPAAPDYDYAW